MPVTQSLFFALFFVISRAPHIAFLLFDFRAAFAFLVLVSAGHLFF